MRELINNMQKPKYYLTTIIVLVLLYPVMIFTNGFIEGWNSHPDFTEEKLKIALENGESVEGKTVEVEVVDVLDSPIMGNLFYTSNDLVFQSEVDNGVKIGQSGKVKIRDAHKIAGAWVINYNIEKDGE